jgi:hypothetical protein
MLHDDWEKEEEQQAQGHQQHELQELRTHMCGAAAGISGTQQVTTVFFILDRWL